MPNPTILIIQDKLNRIKITRAVSKNIFSKHFGNLSKIIKQINDIKT